jgi:glutamate synthase domain-containing protein 1
MRTQNINKFNEKTAQELSKILDMEVSYEYLKRKKAKFTIKNDEDHFIFSIGSQFPIFKTMSISDVFEEMLFIFKLDTEHKENSTELWSRKFKRQVINKTPTEIKYL